MCLRCDRANTVARVAMVAQYMKLGDLMISNYNMVCNAMGCINLNIGTKLDRALGLIST